MPRVDPAAHYEHKAKRARAHKVLPHRLPKPDPAPAPPVVIHNAGELWLALLPFALADENNPPRTTNPDEWRTAVREARRVCLAARREA